MGGAVGAPAAGVGDRLCDVVGVASWVGAAAGAVVGVATAAGVVWVGAGVLVGSPAGVVEAWVQAITSNRREAIRAEIRMDGWTVWDSPSIADYTSIIDSASAKVNAMKKGRGLGVVDTSLGVVVESV